MSKCLTCSLCLVSDKMFPALGFGAQLPPDWKVSEMVGGSGLLSAVHSAKTTLVSLSFVPL